MKLQAKSPKVSVCIVAYNQQEFIAQCLDSILLQVTNFNFEIIVGDDFSDDGTREIIREYERVNPSVIKGIYHKENIGPVANYLAVHKSAIGEYVCHIDGDDWARPGKLAAQADFLDKYHDCSLVAHQVGVWSKGRQVSTTIVNPENISIGYLLRKHPIFIHSSVMYRKKSLSSIQEVSSFFIDFYVYVSAALSGNIGFINQVLGDYRSGIGISKSRMLMPYIQNAISLAEASVGNTADVRRSRSSAYLSYAVASLMVGEDKEFCRFLSLSVKSDKEWILPRAIFCFSICPGALRFVINIYKNRIKFI